MEPVRPRGRRRRNRTTVDPIVLVVYVGATLTALAFAHLAMKIAALDSDTGVSGTVILVTEPLVWPLARWGVFQTPILGDASLGALCGALIIGVTWFTILGLAAGWEHERRRGRP